MVKYKNKDEYLRKISNFYNTNPQHVTGYFHGKILYEVINKIQPIDKKILDVGCGFGQLIKEIYDIYPNNLFYGVDLSKDNIKQAQKNIKFAKFYIADAEELPLEDNYFDIIFCTDTLEHVYSLANALKEFNRVLKPGGQLIILTPNYFNLIGVIKFLLEKTGISQSNTFSIDLFRQENENFITCTSIQDKLKKFNFKISYFRTLNVVQGFIPGFDYLIHYLCLLPKTKKRLKFISSIAGRVYHFTVKTNKLLEKFFLTKYFASQMIYICRKE